MAEIQIIDPGILSIVEDLGRYGYQRYGVSVSGVMDEYGARMANFLVRNNSGAALIECSLKCPTIEFFDDVVFAVTGAECAVFLNDKPIVLWESYIAQRGDRLVGDFCYEGMRNYIAFAGGIDVDIIMNSRSTNVRGKFGGFMGRQLAEGDILKVKDSNAVNMPLRAIKQAYIPKYLRNLTLNVIMGPQDDYFTQEGIESFLNTPYTLSHVSDRMGIRLEGKPIEHIKGADIISDGIPIGAIQVPGEGLPIIMMNDRQTTGGYAKIASVITPDLWRLAQAPTGSTIYFKSVSAEESVKYFKDYRDFFKSLEEAFFSKEIGGGGDIRWYL
ncbi:MAG: biotin-dependent carboxyltransferase family protein [Elusimicrobiota bacterium]|jgi:biotin-dependent carboxylase-like uncharacterized protein|nr:biotin-dependent carboxyltransferase family protein [Elusimicrobiota bacterium]